MNATIPMQVIATVIAVEGEAFARAMDGSTRRLAAGDLLREGETVITSTGGTVTLAMSDGRELTVLPQESYLMSAETGVPATGPEEAAVTQGGEIDQVIQALEEGRDLDAELEAAAAGLGGGGENGGSSFVRLLRISEGVEPLDYSFPGAPGEAQELPFGGVTGAEPTVEPTPEPTVEPTPEPTLAGNWQLDRSPANENSGRADIVEGSNNRADTTFNVTYRAGGNAILAAGESVVVTFAVSGTATDGEDYLLSAQARDASGKYDVSLASLGEGQYAMTVTAVGGDHNLNGMSFAVTVTAVDDEVHEGEEYAYFRLISADGPGDVFDGIRLDKADVTITIEDNDAAPANGYGDMFANVLPSVGDVYDLTEENLDKPLLVKDFDLGRPEQGGDILRMGDLMPDDIALDQLGEYLSIEQQGQHARVLFDPDGEGPEAAIHILTLQGLGDVDNLLGVLIENNQIEVD